MTAILAQSIIRVSVRAKDTAYATTCDCSHEFSTKINHKTLRTANEGKMNYCMLLGN